jgi:hypothetical protein
MRCAFDNARLIQCQKRHLKYENRIGHVIRVVLLSLIERYGAVVGLAFRHDCADQTRRVDENGFIAD